MRAPLLSALATLVLFVVVGESGLRFTGATPWRPTSAELSVTPGGRFYRADDRLGYAPIEGSFRVRFPTGLVFAATNDSAGLRRMPVPQTRPPADALWIFGGSFTYGWAVDDEASWPYQLALRHPEHALRNFAAPGYGTLHSLFQLEDALQSHSAPGWVLLAYAPFHDRRNTFTRARRKRVAPFNALGPLTQPYARLGADGDLVTEMAEVSYREWPGMRVSALIHRAEEIWNRAEEARIPSAEITREIVRRFIETGRGAGSRVVIATLGRGEASAAMRTFAEGQGARSIELGVDLDRPGYRNLPHDAHPSALAHRVYADRVDDALGGEFSAR